MSECKWISCSQLNPLNSDRNPGKWFSLDAEHSYWITLLHISYDCSTDTYHRNKYNNFCSAFDGHFHCVNTEMSICQMFIWLYVCLFLQLFLLRRTKGGGHDVPALYLHDWRPIWCWLVSVCSLMYWSNFYVIITALYGRVSSSVSSRHSCFLLALKTVCSCIKTLFRFIHTCSIMYLYSFLNC